MKFNSKILDGEFQCEKTDCAWWEGHFGKCGMVVDAYLEGVEDHRKETQEFIRERRRR